MVTYAAISRKNINGLENLTDQVLQTKPCSAADRSRSKYPYNLTTSLNALFRPFRTDGFPENITSRIQESWNCVSVKAAQFLVGVDRRKLPADNLP